jgi:hypothetical protein
MLEMLICMSHGVNPVRLRVSVAKAVRGHNAETPGYKFEILLTVVGFRCARLVLGTACTVQRPQLIPRSLGPLFFEGEALAGLYASP